MKTEAPQIVHIALVMLGLGITLANHGKPKSGKHDFTVTFVATALSNLLLWWGGFFG